MKTSPATALLAVPIVVLLSACTQKPAPESPRLVRTVEVRYDKAKEVNRYVGTVQSRHEVNEAFRVGGKVVQRKVDVGQKVREGDVLAVLDDDRLPPRRGSGASAVRRRHGAGASG